MPEPRIGFIARVVREDHLRANAWRLCSLQLCCFNQFRISAKFAGNFAMKWRSRGRGFKSALLHISVSRVSDIAENRSKSARVRAICDSADPETASLHRQSRKSANFSLGAICLGPRIIAIDSPEDDFALSLYSLDLRSVRAEHSRNRGERPHDSSRPIAHVTRAPRLTPGGVVPISARDTVSVSTDSA